MTNTTEWQDLPDLQAVAKAQADGWKIEESDDYTNWCVWGGGKWSFKKYYRGCPRHIHETNVAAGVKMIAYQWQPISTAPREGWIMVWRTQSVIPRIVRWDETYGAFEDEWGDHIYDLTHWLPLPNDPESSNEL